MGGNTQGSYSGGGYNTGGYGGYQQPYMNYGGYGMSQPNYYGGGYGMGQNSWSMPQNQNSFYGGGWGGNMMNPYEPQGNMPGGFSFDELRQISRNSINPVMMPNGSFFVNGMPQNNGGLMYTKGIGGDNGMGINSAAMPQNQATPQLAGGAHQRLGPGGLEQQPQAQRRMGLRTY